MLPLNSTKQMMAVCPFLLALLIACGPSKKVIDARTSVEHRSSSADSSKDDESATSQQHPDDQNTPLSLADLQTAYGIRSFEQIQETMAAVTGISPLTANVAAIYTEVRTQLPNNNDIKSFLASHQVGVSKLAVEYCDALMNTATLRTQVVPNFNFAAVPSVALNDAGTSQLINSLTSRFWGSGLESLPDPIETEQILEQLVSDLKSGAGQADAAATLRTAKGVCTAILSAAPVTFF